MVERDVAVPASLQTQGTKTQLLLGTGRAEWASTVVENFSGTNSFLFIINSEAIVPFPLLPISEAGSHSPVRITQIRLNSKGDVGRLECMRHPQGVPRCAAHRAQEKPDTVLVCLDFQCLASGEGP